ncbi:N-methyl-L-tryptophan oxidase [Balamuthia mandrillaris]
MAAEHFDIIVIGLGGFGSAALYWAARTSGPRTAHGKRILGLEQFNLGHHHGSSQDHSRIIRLAYDSPAYTRIAPAAYMMWAAVEEESGVQLVHKTGGLVFGDKDDVHVDKYARAMEDQGIPFQDMSGEEAMKRWPQLTLSKDERVLYQADAGIVDPAKANAVHVTLALAHGAEVIEHARVLRLVALGKDKCQVITEQVTPTPSAYTTPGQKTTRKEVTYTCSRVILATGAYTNFCLKSLGVKLPLTITKEQVTYWATPHLKLFSPKVFPVWITYHTNSSGGQKVLNECYGFPVYGEVATKAGVHHGGKEISIDDLVAGKRDIKEVDYDALHRLETVLKEKIPLFIGKRLYTKPCLYENTKDYELVMDTLEACGYPQISVALGSGHGFKWASFIGLVLSQLANKGKSSYPIDSFRIDRPTLGFERLPASSAL